MLLACSVFTLPSSTRRPDGSALLQMLFGSFGVKAVTLHEEATCACLGAGVGSALVVDIGAQRTTVCCVDEGMPMPGCRHILSCAAHSRTRAHRPFR